MFHVLLFINILTFLLALILMMKYRAASYRSRTLQGLIDHVKIGYFRYRVRDGVVLEANKGFIDILDLDMSPREVIGRPISELIIYVKEEGSIRSLLRERGALHDHEYCFRTLKGAERCVLHNSYMVKDPHSGEEVIEALIEDISEKKRSYDRMKESRKRYKQLFRDSGDLVVIFRSEDLVVEEVNPVTEVITGYDPRSIVGKSFVSIVHPERRKDIDDARKDILFSGSARLETLIACKDGRYKEVLITFSTVDINGSKMIMAIGKDISFLAADRAEKERRRKELEDFWHASIKREQRIRDLRQELIRVKEQVDRLRREYGR